MAKRKRKRVVERTRQRRAPSLGEASIADANDMVARNALLLQDMYQSEGRASKAERELAEIRAKLVRLLSPDQIEAARICGVTPEFYALECIELHKAQFFPYMPAEFRPLAVLKREGR